MGKNNNVNGITKTRYPAILEHIEQILSISESVTTEDEIYKNAGKYIEKVSRKLKVTPAQALIFSHMIGRSNETHIYPGELKESLHCSAVQMIRHLNEFEELEKRKLISNMTFRDKKGYCVPNQVIDALRKNKIIKIEGITNLSIYSFFDELEKFLQKRFDDEITIEQYTDELKLLVDNNMHLSVCKALKSYRLGDNALALLSLFCEFHVNNDDEDIDMGDLRRIFDDGIDFHECKASLFNNSHSLIRKGLIENITNGSFGKREEFSLTSKGKDELLGELNISKTNAGIKKGLILAKDILLKEMYYNEDEEKQIIKLTSLLKHENFESVRKRLSRKGICRCQSVA